MPIELLPLIESIYDAALDPNLWASTLVEIATFAEGDRAILISEDRTGSQKAVFFQSETDPEWVSSYLKTYINLNPFRIATAAFAKTGDVYITSDVVSEAEFRRSRFFDWLQERDIVDNSVGIVERTNVAFNVLGVQRRTWRGAADEGVRAKIAAVLPHVRRAAAIGQALEQNRLDLSGLSDTLDHMACGIFLLTATMQIAFANADGLRLLDQQTILRSVNGALIFQDRAAGAEVEAVIGGTAADPRLSQRGIAIPMRSTAGTPYVGHLLPLLTGARRAAGASYRATAILFVRQLDASMASDATPFAQLYGLTPRELSVLAVLLQSSGVKEVSAMMGVSVETVRTHLKAIFQKTGTKRQVDLVKLVANARTPFV